VINITIVLAVLIFALLILVHEGGHFFAAKLSGVRVLEFALGLGPAIFKKKVGETEYCLRALPFGGQCVMDGELEPSGNPRALNNASLPKRVFIIVAGVLMNFLLGYMICLFLILPGDSAVVPKIGGLMDQFTGGGEQGIQVGDEILKIDGYRVLLANDVSTGLGRGDSAPYYDILVRRDGEKLLLTDVKIEPQAYDVDGKQVMYYGFRFSSEKINFFNAFHFAALNSVNMVRVVLLSLGDLFSGHVALSDLSGPVGISVAMGEVAKQSLPDFWFLTALITINLGVMNLLPIPELDGGRLVFLAYESIFKKPVSPKVEAYIHGVGLVLLLILMVVVTFNDIWKLFA